MIALIIMPMFATVAASFVYFLAGIGLGGAILFFIVVRIVNDENFAARLGSPEEVFGEHIQGEPDRSSRGNPSPRESMNSRNVNVTSSNGEASMGDPVNTNQ